MYSKRKIITLSIVYAILLILILLWNNISDFAFTNEFNMEVINAGRQGFSAYREMSIVYVIFVILGFNYLYNEKIYNLIKYNNTIEYLKKYILRKMIVNISLFTIIHFVIAIVNNLIYLDFGYFIESNLWIIIPLNSILFFLFYLIIMLLYIILT